MARIGMWMGGVICAAFLLSLYAAENKLKHRRGAPPKARAAAAEALGVLDPTSIPKYVDPLVIPPVMPPMGQGGQRIKDKGAAATLYQISVKQFDQQILPTSGYGDGGLQPFPKTIVWGYGRFGDSPPGRDGPSTYNSPAFTIEARTNERVRVRWVNELVDKKRSYLPHLLPVDQTLHWANPPGPRDRRGTDPEPYEGPVPIITHVHGAHVGPTSDGYPEAWYLPNAKDIPGGYFTQGTNYGTVIPAAPGSAWFEYPNDQRATTLWYHDHSLGMTRLNVYAGLAGFWLIRDEAEAALNLPGPAPRLGDGPNTKYYEIPIVVQDRSFYTDGQLFYPDDRAYFEGVAPDEFNIPTIPEKVDGKTSDVSPIWNPEFFGNTMMVNGRTWPFLTVEPRRYRFRFLNGCNSRTLILKFNEDLSFHQIGSDGGLLPDSPVTLGQLPMGPAERADVIVDFASFEPGDEIILLNVGPDEPFKGLDAGQDPADPNTTGVVMKFKVVGLTVPDTSVEMEDLELPSITALGDPQKTRDLTLNEAVSEVVDVDGEPLVEGKEPFGPIAAFLGTAADGPLPWMAAITEKPKLGDTEVWRLVNLTEDAHPMHLHLVMFQVLDRTPFDAEAYATAQEAYLAGDKSGPPPDPLSSDFWPGGVEPDPILPRLWETGWKDTVISPPGHVTRIKAVFDMLGLYVWHCHILEHEDNEMMRPFKVIP